MRVASIVGARPNFIKLMPVDKALNGCAEHIIIHTGQHYDFEMSEIFFKEFTMPRPAINLDVGSNSAGLQVAEMMKRLVEFMKSSKFDVVLVYGDTNSTFAGAFVANRLNLKLAHIEAGLRSFDRRMPEEINRILTDHLSDYLFAPTNNAVRNLEREHVYGKIISAGDVSVEVIREAEQQLSKSNILDQLKVKPKSYVLFTMHRAENTISKEQLGSILQIFRELVDMQFVFPIHPRTVNSFREHSLYERLAECKNVILIKPVGYIDFIKLLKNAQKVITDSGGVQKEAYLLKIPCVTIRKSTEWTETVDAGWNKITDTDPREVVKAVREWLPEKVNIPIFGDGSTSRFIRDSILSIAGG